MVLQCHSDGMIAPAAILTLPRRKGYFAAHGHRERGSELLSAPPLGQNRPYLTLIDLIGSIIPSPLPAPMDSFAVRNALVATRGLSIHSVAPARHTDLPPKHSVSLE